MPARKKKKNTLPVPAPNYLAGVLTGLGILCMVLWSIHAYIYHVTLAPPDAVVNRYAVADRDMSIPVSIDIPNVAQLAVTEARKIRGTWTVSDTQANHVKQSSVPGRRGNMIIYGHNTKNIFGNLKRLKPGSTISVVAQNGMVYRYQVEFTKTVKPSDTSLLEQTSTEVLTLYTCTGWLDSKRFVVRAIPV